MKYLIREIETNCKKTRKKRGMGEQEKWKVENGWITEQKK